MRVVAHGEAWFEESVDVRLLHLALLQCSAIRSAYQAIHKRGLSAAESRKDIKSHYMPELNVRHISDAVSLASKIEQDHALFGGKHLWKQYLSKLITKAEWILERNKYLYSRGDKTKQGNPNIRIDGDSILVNDPAGRGKWLRGKLYIPDKFLVDTECYEVRLIRKKKMGVWEVIIAWEAPDVPLIPVVPGGIGIDANPSGIALVEVEGSGNMQYQHWIAGERIESARKGKRNYDINIMANEIVEYALQAAKPIVLEKLKFGKKVGYQKFRRTCSNFTHRKMVDAIKLRAAKMGVPVIEVNPAYTTDLGQLKYAEMYSLSKHSAAALVIARRGMGFKEWSTFSGVYGKEKKTSRDEKTGKKITATRLVCTLAGRGRSLSLSEKSFSWLCSGVFLRDIPKVLAGFTAPGLEPACVGISP